VVLATGVSTIHKGIGYHFKVYQIKAAFLIEIQLKLLSPENGKSKMKGILSKFNSVLIQILT
jgi:hypothetical protein